MAFTSLNKYSIKTLTILGFSLVTLPLIIALLYGMFQVNKLSQQGSSAIINMASLIQTNKELSDAMKSMQRFSSQYVVLKENALFEQYATQRDKALHLLSNNILGYHDPELSRISDNLLQKISTLNIQKESNTATIKQNQALLDTIEKQFNLLATTNYQFNERSNALINLHADDIKHSANKVSAIMMNSLLSIPITLIISGVFILVITRPMKLLSMKINRLERGYFDKKIHFSGSAEMQEIADALELMRARLHTLELQKSSFIRHISHELKTPLAAIREGTELLYDNSVGPLNTDQQEITNILKESVSRLQNLIEDLLDFNIVLDSTSLHDAESVSIASLIEQCLLVRKLELQQKKIHLDMSISPLMIKANSKQLSVIIDNILSNAIKYSPQSATLSISAELINEYVIITFIDEGPGIEESSVNQVFDAFYQGAKPIDNTIKSSGLGLTIVKELLLRLNGTIELSSRSLEQTGLVVKINLPYFNQEGRN